jgi:thioredoxin reductase
MGALVQRGVQVEAAPVRRISGTATVELADGRQLEMAGLFTLTRTSMASPLAQQLGCAFDEGPTGPVIRTDALMAASVPGVFACGDAGRMMSNIAIAVADGALAGVATHRSLIF